MKPESQSYLQPVNEAQAAVVRASFAVVIVVACLLTAYWATTWSMVSTWLRSDTFTHGFIIAPISVWLMWQKRHEIVATGISPSPWMAGIVGLSGMLWLIGTMAGVQVIAQFSLVLMIQATVVAIFGIAASRHLVFPIAFLFFAVPFGEFMVPSLMVWTAGFTVAALKFTGVPVYQEGLYFVIPTGSWSVIEACSGVRFIIASVMVGSLYSYLLYRSTGRRLAFLLASMIVPIIANWLRAYMIVMIGHLSNNRLAAGVDHLVYGWVLFAVIIFILFWIGARWRQDSDTSITPDRTTRLTKVRATRRLAIVSICVLAIGIAWRPAQALIDSPTTSTFSKLLAKVEPQAGWLPAVTLFESWKPDYVSPRLEKMQYLSKGPDKIGLYIAYYARQTSGSELISSINRVVPHESKEWIMKKSGTADVVINQTRLPVRWTLIGTTKSNLLVWHWHWVDGRWTINDYFAKLLLARSKLLSRGDDAAAVFVFTPADSQIAQGEETLREFLTDMLPSVEKALVETRDQ